GRNDIKAAALVRLNKALGSGVEAPVTPELSKALGVLLGSGDPQLVGGALPFAARWVKDESLSASLAPVTAALLAALADASRPDAARVDTLASLLSLPSARARAIEAASALLGPSTSADLQKGVIEALGNVADAGVPSALLDAWPRLSGGSRDAALAQLLRRPEWSSAVVDRLAARTLNPNELGPSALFRLRTHPDGAVAKKAAAVLESVGGGNAAKAAIVEKLWPEVEKPGDLARGKALLTEHCLKCHQYKGEGRAIAPDLTGMGVHGKHELLVHVIDPNRTVEGNYVSFNVRTKDGEVFNGLVARETKDAVVLKNNEGDREIRRASIDVMRSTGLSLMPEGLEALGPDALRDILSFLASEAGNFRFLDLGPAFTASTLKGIYDPQREPQNLKLAKFGVVRADAVPFNLVDPAKSLNGNNAIVLKGGNLPDWWSKTSAPRKVEIPVGFAASKIHVLGGIAAWGAVRDQKGRPTVKVTFHFADGSTSVRVLHDGVEFADWIRRIDVSGSKYAEGVLQPGAPGQVRWFTMPVPKKTPLQLIALESYDHDVAPTFLAMTAEIGEAKEGSQAPATPVAPVLVVGGGSSHDFDRWWKGTDAETLGAAYTDDVASVAAKLPSLQVLYLANNQPMKDPGLRKAIFDFADGGKGLLLGHAATWYNWADWPEYNRQLVGGGTRGHEKLQEFVVRVEDEGHPLAAGVPKSFRVKDELYRFKKDPEGPEIHVVAVGTSLETGQVYPVLWTVKRPGGRVACLTLGHDGDAHGHAAYQAILRNAAGWLSKEKQ
ncbi:MAG TPA: ThuA domain-containing protein, partial [Planctomycetota bacterium]|nr:ThuA domain-containing protein [Planctomycetota bacterium]